MNANRPYVLSIAGFDPSAGAGVLADIKTMEANGVYGLGVTTCITYQNDISFKAVDWLNIDQILNQIAILFERHQFNYVKIGLVKDFQSLLAILKFLKSLSSHIKVIWDPILKASAGFEFHSNVDEYILNEILNEVYLITPNIPEIRKLSTIDGSKEAAINLSRRVNVLLKGGHSSEATSNDFLYSNETEILMLASDKLKFSKHGTGCVLSSAIASNLAKGHSLVKSCTNAKEYITKFICSTEKNLGFHLNMIHNEHSY